MHRLKEALKVALLAWWLILSIGLGYELVKLRPTLETTLRDTHTTVIETGLTMKNLREASELWKDASNEQIDNSQKVLVATSQTLKAYGNLAEAATQDLSTLTLTLNKSVEQQNQALLSSQADLRANLKAVLSTTTALQKTIADADSVIADPAIKESVDNLAETTGNAVDATKHLSNITADGEKTADYYTKRLTTPQGFVKTLLQAILQLGSQARILFSH